MTDLQREEMDYEKAKLELDEKAPLIETVAMWFCVSLCSFFGIYVMIEAIRGVMSWY